MANVGRIHWYFMANPCVLTNETLTVGECGPFTLTGRVKHSRHAPVYFWTRNEAHKKCGLLPQRLVVQVEGCVIDNPHRQHGYYQRSLICLEALEGPGPAIISTNIRRGH
ncbi:hypothetical protein J6590_031147 [Homalodisca vitripennis]|nr:hypothetical protein J6590_031147 [Homalodisca vitripennis]